MASSTPMVRQYDEIKQKHQDAILFFRLGDFYEMFNEDAQIASRELELTLTGRGAEGNRMPMCGIPYHAASNYISRLINKGHKVAICEQVEDPKAAKGVVKREVIKIVTPGTVLESSMLSAKKNNYLLALTSKNKEIGLAYIDISTGEFKTASFKKEETQKVIDEVERIAPTECLIGEKLTAENDLLLNFLKAKKISLSVKPEIGDEKLEGAALLILDYLEKTQKVTLEQIQKITPYHTSEFMFLDATSRRNLELTHTIKDQKVEGSLLGILDKTLTPMGARTLRQFLTQPLLEPQKIANRQDAVAEVKEDLVMREELKEILKDIYDIERLTSRVAAGSANARDLIALKESLDILPQVQDALKISKSSLLKRILEKDSLNECADLIEKAIIDEPPVELSEGGIIKTGFDSKIDELRTAKNEGQGWITAFEAEERQHTGIRSLKVGFTNVFGYFIEVTTANSKLVPPHYIRKQTLTGGERFITPELKEKEDLILGAEEKLAKLEYEVFTAVRREIATYTSKLQEIANLIGETDVFLSFAEIAQANNYTRPEITTTNQLIIKEGRHPVVEKNLGPHKFVPNDTLMKNEENRFLIITGPNMAGKSTYMRQVALTVLLAQIGSFVPATSAKVPIIDRIFTRVGALDDLSQGQSTFMVEMTETANILNAASEKSLIILDEIGRGTSTFDGMSIACAVAEHIHSKIKAKTLFATHYHELTQLTQKHKGMANYNTLVKEEGDHVTFLHRISAGAADRSYGIQVARLAGLPHEVIKRAKEVYSTLEMVENDLSRKTRTTKTRKTKTKENKSDQIGLF